MYDFRANIAILLNITPDHLDRYDNSMQNYTDAKMRIIQNQTPQDAFIYWADDPIISKELKKYDIKAVQCPFSALKKNGVIGYMEEGQYKLEYPTPFNMEQESLSLTRWLPDWLPISLVSRKSPSARRSATSPAWNTAWRRSAKSVASTTSTTQRPPMSMHAGMPWIR